MSKWEVVIGLETHVELATKSKLFCACPTTFGSEPNTNTCPACVGMPATLPKTNKRAVELGVVASVLTNCSISPVITFEKKNYFYPDLPTGYQITQIFAPIGTKGFVDIETNDGAKRINLKQIHIEQDAGKLVHDARHDVSLVDYNRAGVPLIEVVTEPDFRSADEVNEYLNKLQALFSYANVSDCKMQEGSMRCDVNISVRKSGDTQFGVRTEIKNMNSFKAIKRAIEYETERHIDALETNCEVLKQETRRFDDNKGMSFGMRTKEEATDYRYFPDADIYPIAISENWINEIKKTIPESLAQKKERFVNVYGLSDYDAGVLLSNINLCFILDETVKEVNEPKEIANYLTVHLAALAKYESLNLETVAVCPAEFGKIIALVKQGKINRETAKRLFFEHVKHKIDVFKYVEENDLLIKEDLGALEEAIKQALNENPKSVAEYKSGNQKVIPFFMGQVMRKLTVKQDPKAVTEHLIKALNSL
jgi:aspartyl-tRNA(Asn)/glutamyl-tRNA(Gln) amidotransferase subunit B